MKHHYFNIFMLLVACGGEKFSASPATGTSDTPENGGASNAGSAGHPGGAAGTNPATGGTSPAGQAGTGGTTTGGSAGSAGTTAAGAGGGTGGAGGPGGAGGQSGECIAGTYSCDGAYLRRCEGEPLTWQDLLECPGERCVEEKGTCLPCTPGEVVGCFNEVSQLVCTKEGKSDESAPCPAQTPWCDKGACRACLEDKHCQLQGDPECASVHCIAGACVHDFVAAETVVAPLSVGDCKHTICDGNGKLVTTKDTADLPKDDGNPCTIEGCNQDQPETSFADTSTACTVKDKPSFCDGKGSCVFCQEGATRCGEDGKSTETCQDGDWHATPCAIGVPVCAQGSCVGVKQLALGEAHSCALFEDGHVRCWGANTAGQLGNGLDGLSYQNPATVVVGLNDATQIVAGARHTCALRKDKTAVCWGDNTRSQLGYAGASTSSTPKPAELGAPVTKLAAGGANTCALFPDQGVRCWGDSTYGQISSSGFSTPSPSPFSFEATELFAVGDGFICAKTSQGVYCRGKNNMNQVGAEYSYTHNQVWFQNISELALGKDHACIRTQEDNAAGAIYCWGSSTNNKLGSFFLQGQYTQGIAFTSKGSSLSLGYEHLCQIAPAPGVFVECFGDTSHYQLGNDKLELTEAVKSSPEATLLATGGYHTCAYSPQKGLFCWGENEQGQTGSGGSGKNKLPAPVLW